MHVNLGGVFGACTGGMQKLCVLRSIDLPLCCVLAHFIDLLSLARNSVSYRFQYVYLSHSLNLSRSLIDLSFSLARPSSLAVRSRSLLF
jgi:hypothetical protein